MTEKRKTIKGREVVATETLKWKQKLSGAGGRRKADLVAEGRGRGWRGQAWPRLAGNAPLPNTPHPAGHCWACAPGSRRAAQFLPSLHGRCLVPE